MKTSNKSKSHLKVRAGLRPKRGSGVGAGQSVTAKQLAAYRKAARKSTK
jgi:hypothetical protein